MSLRGLIIHFFLLLNKCHCMKEHRLFILFVLLKDIMIGASFLVMMMTISFYKHSSASFCVDASF